jgi:hypothetical protein
VSRKVATLVYSKQAGSMARKAVLAYFADRANDDGSGVWAAKQRIADEIECSKQTVITVVKGLVADGLIRETGKRPNSNGYTVEYAIILTAVESLPDSKRDADGVQFLTGQDLDGSTSQTPRGQAALPKPSLNRPSQKTSSSSKARARKAPAFVLPADIPADEWRDYEEMRRSIRKPMTHSIRSKAITRLRKLRDEDGWPPGDVLNHSTLNSYQGLFPPPRETRHGKPTRSDNGFFNACVDMGRGRTG